MLKVSGLQLSHLSKSENSDQVRKLLKHVSDILRRIEEKHQAAAKVEDVFSLELMSLRTRLKELLLKIYPLDPRKSGSKVLEYYWRKCYHEPVSVSRQLRGSGWTKHQTALIQSHLISGIGTYQHIILFLTESFGWTSSFSLDFSPRSPYGWSAGPERRGTVEAERLSEAGVDQTWVESQVVKCLVWCGDLSRYMEAEAGAERYYLLSCRLAPTSGQAYNNLAMCSANRNFGLDQLYFYLRCVNCKVGSENGQANLKRLLDGEKAAVVTEAGGAEANLVAGLVQLVRSVTGGESQEKMTASCQQSLASLHSCLLAPSLALSSSWLTVAVSSVILLVQHRSEPLCKAWLLAILSHLAGKLSQDVLAEYPALELKEPEKNVEEEKEKKEEVNKKKKNRLEDLLRRRRAGQSGSEGENSEESSDETYDSEEEESDEELEEEDDNSDDEFYLESSSEEDDDDEDVVVEDAVVVPSQSELVSLSNRGEILKTIVLCQSWLQSNHEILAQTGSGSEQMWENLATFFNVLCLTVRESLVQSAGVTELLSQQERCEKFTPLPEDWLLRGIFSERDERFDWSRQFSSQEEQQVGRVRRVADFRTWLCGQADSKITWDSDNNITRFRKDIVETDKKNVMKHMAELWLRQEVDDLENAEKEGGTVVVDCPALVTNLAMVKRTLGLKKVTVVVPSVAVRQLDSLKKSERGAREAIRWLERELSRGTDWLKAQKPEESLPLERPGETLERSQLQLLECLSFFISSQGQEVTLLTGDKDILEGGTEFLGEIRDKLHIENIDGFVPRYLGIADRNGKSKRKGGRGKRRRDLENIG